MWICTTGGFYSAVQKGSDPNVLTVRTRAREAAQLAADTLETEFGERVKIEAGAGADYPYRFEVSRENFALWLAHEAREYVAYSNFKDAVATGHGKTSGYSLALAGARVALLDCTDEEAVTNNYGEPPALSGSSVSPHYNHKQDVAWQEWAWDEFERLGPL